MSNKILILITNKCNKNCKFCFVKSKRENACDMTMSSFKKVISALLDNNVSYVVLAGGEPTLHPQLSIFLNMITDANISFSIISNGSFTQEAFHNCKIEGRVISVHCPRNRTEQLVISKNIRFLRHEGAKIMLRDVVTDGYDFKQLLAFCTEEKDYIDSIKLKLALPDINKQNEFLREFGAIRTPLLMALEHIKACDITIQNCCFLPYCEFSQEDQEKFSSLGYNSHCLNPFYIDVDESIRLCPFHDRVFGDLSDLPKIFNYDAFQIPINENCLACEKWHNKKCVPCLACHTEPNTLFPILKTFVLESKNAQSERIPRVMDNQFS